MKRTVRLTFLALLLLVLLFSSCVTRSPIGDEQYFQGLGLDGEFVVTINAELLDVDDYITSDDAGVNYITDRMTRLSVALYDSKGTAGPVTEDFSEFDYYGAIEGYFSKTLVSSALSLNSLFSSEKDKDTKLKFFIDSQSGLEAAIPANGIILFSSTDVVDNYRRTYTEGRPSRISDADAAKLAASQVGVYVSNPRTMINLGFDINEQSLSNIDTILMVMDDDTITADFRLKSEDLADSFSILIKASYVGNLRREGIKVNVAELKEMFTQQLNTVRVNGMPLSQEQKDSIIQVITSLLESL